MAVNPTAIWRVRPSGSNTNGGGFDAAISGAGTDYSKQNSAQANGTNGVATGTTAFTDATANAFTSAMIGNALYITGGGLTTGWYFCTGFTSSSIITLDRTPGTGSAATWHLGGAWADFWTNLQTGTAGVTSGSFPVIGQNIVYVLGSGTPNPAAYSYDYVLGGTMGNWVVGSNTTGNIIIDNDPATPGYKQWPDCSGGMPLINVNSNVLISSFVSQWFSIRGLWTDQPGGAPVYSGFRDSDIRGCVVDTKDNGVEVEGMVFGCEVFSSRTYTNGAGVHAFSKSHIVDCNIHDYPGLGADNCGPITGSIFRKCGNGAIKTGGNSFGPFMNNTIDATVGHGVEYDNISRLTTQIFNNIFSNHQTVSTAALKGPGGTAAVNSSIATMIASNVFYNNLNNYIDLVAAPYDTNLVVDPYVNQSTGNYTLA